MHYVHGTERPTWRGVAEQAGFHFHTMDGERYWDERGAYAFPLAEVEDVIEGPTTELYGMCLRAVERVVHDERLMNRLRIPAMFHNMARESWRRQDPALYARFDLSYNGQGPAKMLELNADTPTALYEAAAFQWQWLEDVLRMGLVPHGSDQFNSMEENLADAFRAMGVRTMHFAWYEGEDPVRSTEDRSTVDYLAAVARDVDIETRLIPMEAIGVDAMGRFVDERGEEIMHLFKLYPWEWMFREDFGKHLPVSRTRFVEPPWKAVLSNKGVLAVLWEMFEGHPNLLPAYFADDPRAQELRSYVRKPLYSREGANITVVVDGETVIGSEDIGYGAEGYVVQAYHPLPQFPQGYPVIGSWVINGKACGMGIREDATPITVNTSRFIPHFIVP